MSAGSGPAPRAPGAHDDRVSWVVYLLVIALSLLVGAIAVVRTAASLTSIADSDLANFFLKSAAYIARGDPWHMYAARASPPYATYPNVVPPLGIALLAPPLRWAQALGVARSYRAQVAFVALPFVATIPLLGGLAVAALRAARPVVPPATRALAFAAIALGPLSWLCVATWGHLEQPVMLCLLVAAVIALQRRRAAVAGVLLGLAVLAGTAALFPALALVALLLASGRRQWRTAALVGGLALLVVAAGMAPFLLADRRDTLYSFVTWRGGEQIGGDALWSVFTVAAIARALPHAAGALIRRLDTPAIAALAVGVAVLAARRLRVAADGPDVWAVLAVAALGLPLLAKVVWPYYYLQPFVLLLLYEGGTMQRRPPGVWRWPVLTVGFLVAATTLAPYIGLRSVGGLDRVATGLLQSGAMLAVVLATWRQLRAEA